MMKIKGDTMGNMKLEEIRKDKAYIDRPLYTVKAKKGDVYTITASTADIDRDGEVILPSAYKNSLPAYLEKNPVILWMHDMFSPPIARATGGRVADTFELDINFASTPFAQEIKTLVDEGMLNTVSIGGLVKDFEYNNDGVKVITDIELWEVSVVTIPSNRSAVIQRAKVAGLNLAYEAIQQQTSTSVSSAEVDKESKSVKEQKEKMLSIINLMQGVTR
jgi:HK97 family phage prohead protease